MKHFLFIFLIVFTISVSAQIPKSGTYTYNWCDEEYGHCMEKCKIKFNGNKVWIYAPANLSDTKEGELVWQGTLFKHKSGKWFVKELNKKSNPKIIGGFEGPP